MTNTFPLAIITLVLLLVIQLSFYNLSQKFKKGDLSDFGWTLSVLMFAIAGFVGALDYNFTVRSILILSLVTIWALRIGYLILIKRVFSKGEDSRYSYHRKKWGSQGKYKFFIMFMAQPFIALILCVPFYYAFISSVFSIFDYLGLALWIVGFVGILISDYQLAKFKKSSKSGVCEHGLWYCSRHPNYFFEWILWCSYPLFTLSLNFNPEVSFLSFGTWWVFISPLFLLFLFFKVTGIPPAEAQSLRRRGDEYRKYQKTTSVFFPLPKKKG